MSRNSIREDSIYISKETKFYLRILAKAKCEGTEARMTEDQMGDCLLRETITTMHPDLVALYAEWEQAKQDAGKVYGKIEARMIAAVASPVSSGDNQPRTQEETKTT